MMPRISGNDVLRALRANPSTVTLPIVVVSAVAVRHTTPQLGTACPQKRACPLIQHGGRCALPTLLPSTRGGASCTPRQSRADCASRPPPLTKPLAHSWKGSRRGTAARPRRARRGVSPACVASWTFLLPQPDSTRIRRENRNWKAALSANLSQLLRTTTSAEVRM